MIQVCFKAPEGADISHLAKCIELALTGKTLAEKSELNVRIVADPENSQVLFNVGSLIEESDSKNISLNFHMQPTDYNNIASEIDVPVEVDPEVEVQEDITSKGEKSDEVIEATVEEVESEAATEVEETADAVEVNDEEEEENEIPCEDVGL